MSAAVCGAFVSKGFFGPCPIPRPRADPVGASGQDHSCILTESDDGQHIHRCECGQEWHEAWIEDR